MGRFNFRKTFSLEEADDNFNEECYVTFNNFKFKDLERFRKLGISDENITSENLEKIVNVLEEKFVEGKAILDGELVPLQSEDLHDFPGGVIGQIIEWTIGKIDPKAKPTLNKPS